MSLLTRASRAARAFAIRTLAVLLILVGMVVFPLPIPVGLLMIVMGLALLISSSHTIARLVREYRRRNPRLDSWLRKAEPRIPTMLRAPLRKTDPLHQPEPPEASVEAPSLPEDEGPG